MIPEVCETRNEATVDGTGPNPVPSLRTALATLALTVMALVGCRSTATTAAPVAEPSAPLNSRATIKLVNLEGHDPAGGVCERLARHQSIHAVIQVPDGAKPGGPLLDPLSIEVALDEQPLETYILYRNPTVALVFATVDEDRATTPTELTITARFVDESDMAAGWRLPLSPTADQVARSHAPANRTGRTIRVMDVDGQGVAEARVFGQRREDLFAIADSDGHVILDAPTRSSFETHFAWAPGTWVTRFDAIREPEPVLVQRRRTETHRSFTLDLVGSDGLPMNDAWLLVNDADWVRWTPGRIVRLPLRKDRKNLLNVIAAGYQVKAIEFEKTPAEKRLVLEPLGKQ
ncbi:hypothetical protein GC173_00730 [bacterium]|nr:hypothetical protein [bacterium]